MRIIHCADVHLDSSLQTNLSPEKAKERNAELLRGFERMVEYADQNEVGAVLIAGDLFDTAQVSKTTGSVVYQAIVGHPEINFYYLKGNHDADSFLASMEEIPDNLAFFEESWSYYEEGMVTIAAAELNGKNADTLYRTLLLERNRINIVMLHGQESAYAGKDSDGSIHLEALKDKGIDYLALGHVHSYKEEMLDSRGRYCYPGCLEGRGFDECGEHGFVLLDIDEEKKQINSTFVPFAKRKLYRIEVDITNCGDVPQIRNAIEQTLSEQLIEEKDLVKVVLTGKVDVSCDKSVEILEKYLEERYYCIKLEDQTKLAVDDQDYRLDESLKGEFVRMVLADTSLSEELRTQVIRCGIRALSGEELE